jgi:hypothetical protein
VKGRVATIESPHRDHWYQRVSLEEGRLYIETVSGGRYRLPFEMSTLYRIPQSQCPHHSLALTNPVTLDSLTLIGLTFPIPPPQVSLPEPGLPQMHAMYDVMAPWLRQHGASKPPVLLWQVRDLQLFFPSFCLRFLRPWNAFLMVRGDPHPKLAEGWLG